MSNSTTESLIFTQHEWDTENSSYNTAYRQYSPGQGRWLTPDPYAGSYNLADPQSFNRYTYAANAPATNSDPLGLTVNLTISYWGSASGGVVTTGDSWFDDDGMGATFIGGHTQITETSSNAAPISGWGQRESYSYRGPGATSAHDSSRILDWVQMGIRGLGVLPEAGVPLNALNAVIDLARGKYREAAFDGGAALASFVGAGGLVDAAELAETAVVAEEGVGTAVEAAETAPQIFYRGDQAGMSSFQSYAARAGGIEHSQAVLDNGNLTELMSNHAIDSANPASPFISVTTDPAVARVFAGPEGTVYTLQLAPGRAILNTQNPLSESEWLVPHEILPGEIQ